MNVSSRGFYLGSVTPKELLV